MNPAIGYLTGRMRSGATSPITCYRRTATFDVAQHNRTVIAETSFTLIAHVGREARRGKAGNEGGRQTGDLKMQVDADQPELVTVKEASVSGDNISPDIVVWMGDRYQLADVDDLTGHPIPMLRTRTYSLVRANPE